MKVTLAVCYSTQCKRDQIAETGTFRSCDFIENVDVGSLYAWQRKIVAKMIPASALNSPHNVSMLVLRDFEYTNPSINDWFAVALTQQ